MEKLIIQIEGDITNIELKIARIKRTLMAIKAEIESNKREPNNHIKIGKGHFTNLK